MRIYANPSEVNGQTQLVLGGSGDCHWQATLTSKKPIVQPPLLVERSSRRSEYQAAIQALSELNEGIRVRTKREIETSSRGHVRKLPTARANALVLEN